MRTVILLKAIQLILTIVIGLILLSYLWPVFLLFAIIIGVYFIRFYFRLRNAATQQPEQPRDLSRDDDIEKPIHRDVIDADYKERE